MLPQLSLYPSTILARARATMCLLLDSKTHGAHTSAEREQCDFRGACNFCEPLSLLKCYGHSFQGAHGVVASHPLCMRKALGSNPSVSIFKEDHRTCQDAVDLVLLLGWPGHRIGGIDNDAQARGRKEMDCKNNTSNVHDSPRSRETPNQSGNTVKKKSWAPLFPLRPSRKTEAPLLTIPT